LSLEVSEVGNLSTRCRGANSLLRWAVRQGWPGRLIGGHTIAQIICALVGAGIGWVPLSRCSSAAWLTNMSVQASLESDDQYSEQRADARAQHATSKTESAATARKEAVAGQQHGASDHGNPGVGNDIYAE
jgi:hypothetical protein